MRLWEQKSSVSCQMEWNNDPQIWKPPVKSVWVSNLWSMWHQWNVCHKWYWHVHVVQKAGWHPSDWNYEREAHNVLLTYILFTSRLSKNTASNIFVCEGSRLSLWVTDLFSMLHQWLYMPLLVIVSRWFAQSRVSFMSLVTWKICNFISLFCTLPDFKEQDNASVNTFMNKKDEIGILEVRISGSILKIYNNKSCQTPLFHKYNNGVLNGIHHIWASD